MKTLTVNPMCNMCNIYNMCTMCNKFKFKPPPTHRGLAGVKGGF